MSTMLHETASAGTAYPAPAWANAVDESCDPILWNRKIEFAAVEVDGPESLTVEAYCYDHIKASVESGVMCDRMPEIQLTRHSADGSNDNEVPLRFEMANARRVAAAILMLVDAVEKNLPVTMPDRVAPWAQS